MESTKQQKAEGKHGTARGLRSAIGVLVAGAGAFGLGVLAPFVFAQTQAKVGDSKDGCDRDEVVKFQAKEGTVSVRANKSVTADLPGMTTEMSWYCGGSRERVANDKSFNRVRASRSNTGSISWTFFRVSAAPTPPSNDNPGTPPNNTNTNANFLPEGMTRVGSTNDACGETNVKVNGMDGSFLIKKGQMRLIELAKLTREMNWRCGDTKERVANANSFNWVQVERAGNGAIHWVFYRAPEVPAVYTGEYVHNCSGNVRTAVNLGPGPSEVPAPMPNGFMKTTLDNFWNQQRATVAQMIRTQVANTRKDMRINSLALATAASAEMRLASQGDDVLLKYVVHGNHVNATLILPDPAPDPTMVATFDLELTIRIPRSQNINSLDIRKADGAVRHVEIVGDNAMSDLSIAIMKSRVRAMETTMGNTSQDISTIVRQSIGVVMGQIKKAAPQGFNFVGFATEPAGLLTICLKTSDSATSQLAPRPALSNNRAVLGRSVDRCGQSALWMWDAEKGRFVRILKNQKNLVVEVDNPRFEWFCGDVSAPNGNNDEWASGPKRTYAVRVSRDSGDRIDWDFLNWK